jgi:hypothetical protein
MRVLLLCGDRRKEIDFLESSSRIWRFGNKVEIYLQWKAKENFESSSEGNTWTLDNATTASSLTSPLMITPPSSLHVLSWSLHYEQAEWGSLRVVSGQDVIESVAGIRIPDETTLVRIELGRICKTVYWSPLAAWKWGAFTSGNTSRSAIDHAFLQDLPCSDRITSKGVRGSESGLILAWILSTILLVKDYSASLLNSVDPDHFPWGSGNKHDSENCVPYQPQVMLESFLEQEYIVAEPKWRRVFRVIYPERARSKCLRGYRCFPTEIFALPRASDKMEKRAFVFVRKI